MSLYFPEDPKKKTNKHIQSWLRVTSLIDDISDQRLLQKFVEQITISIGYKESLYLLAKSVSNEQCITMRDNIYKIKLNDKIINSPQEPINSDDDQDGNEQDIDITPTVHFSLLSDNSLCNICAYLGRRDIKQFKLTSKQIAIICLQEQTKINIKIFNTNRFYIDSGLHLKKLVDNKVGSISRYNPKIPFYRLFEEWNRNYNISEENQIIIQYIHHNQDQPSNAELKLIDSNSLRLEPISAINKNPSITASFIVIDKTKTVILNRLEARKMDIYKDTMDVLQDYRPLILEYFDVITQKHNVCQFILYQKDITYTTILSYIEHKFIYIDGINNKWHNELILNLKQMNYDSSHPKLCIFTHEKYAISYGGWGNREKYQFKMELIKDENIDHKLYNKLESFHTFQINPNHKWFKQTNKMDKVKQNVHGFFPFSNEYFEETAAIKIVLKYEKTISHFDKMVRYYFDNILNGEQREKYNLNEILCIVSSFKDITFKLKQPNLSGLIRIKLSQLLKNMIPPQHIEIFCNSTWTKGERLIWYDSLRCFRNTTTFTFEIVLYDTMSVSTDDRVYRVKIFKPEQCPRPYKEEREENLEVMVMKYKKQFIVKDFVKNMIIENRDKYKGLFDECLMDDNELNDEMSYLLTLDHRRSTGYKLAETFHHETEMKYLGQLNLYMIRVRNNDENKYKLSIRFNVNDDFNKKTDINKVDEIKYAGIPLIIWIDKKDTLQSVINKYLQDKIKEYIKFTYRVMKGKKIVSISKSQRGKYKLYNQILKEYPNDFIVITLKNRLYCDVFPPWVQREFSLIYSVQNVKKKEKKKKKNKNKTKNKKQKKNNDRNKNTNNNMQSNEVNEYKYEDEESDEHYEDVVEDEDYIYDDDTQTFDGNNIDTRYAINLHQQLNKKHLRSSTLRTRSSTK